jgi:alcohol dehydrogenase
MISEYFGSGSLSQLEKILDEVNPKKIFLVTGKKSFQSSGAADTLMPILDKYRHQIFNDFTPNPKLVDIQKGIDLFDDDVELVISVGGGSVIDVGKSINILKAQIGSPVDYITKIKEIIKPGCPLVAIPTTAGSGSEATHFAVVYVNGVKYSLAHEYIQPNFVVIDPSLTLSMPKYVTASTGMDALAQAVESCWSINSTSESKEFAKKAISIVNSNLKKSVATESLQYREKMAQAANLAGKAINISKTTAPHALSYMLTSKYGIAHGHAAILTLGSILEYNSYVSETDCNDKRGSEYVTETLREIVTLLKCKDAIGAKHYLETYMNEIGLESNLSQLGADDEGINDMVEKVNYERLKNNPRALSDKTQLKRILYSLCK